MVWSTSLVSYLLLWEDHPSPCFTSRWDHIARPWSEGCGQKWEGLPSLATACLSWPWRQRMCAALGGLGGTCTGSLGVWGWSLEDRHTFCGHWVRRSSMLFHPETWDLVLQIPTLNNTSYPAKRCSRSLIGRGYAPLFNGTYIVNYVHLPVVHAKEWMVYNLDMLSPGRARVSPTVWLFFPPLPMKQESPSEIYKYFSS